MTELQAAASESVFSPERRRLTFGLVLTVTLVAFESLAVSTVMPRVEDDLGDLALYGWVFSAFFLGTLVGAVLAGESADRRGTAPPFVLGLVLFSHRDRRRRSGAVDAGARGRPRAAGHRGRCDPCHRLHVGRPRLPPRPAAPGVRGVLERLGDPRPDRPDHRRWHRARVSWRFVFWAILPLVVIAGVMTLPALRESDRANPPTVAAPSSRVRRAVVLAGGAALVLGATGADQLWLTLVLAATGVPIAIWAFTRLVPEGTLRIAPGVPAAVAVRGILTFAFFGTDAFIALAATDARDQSTFVAGAALTTATVAWTAAAWVQQHRVHIDGPRRLVTVGLVLVAAGIGGGILLAGTGPIPVAIVVWGLAGFGTGLSYAPLSVTVLGMADARNRGCCELVAAAERRARRRPRHRVQRRRRRPRREPGVERGGLVDDRVHGDRHGGPARRRRGAPGSPDRLAD